MEMKLQIGIYQSLYKNFNLIHHEDKKQRYSKDLNARQVLGDGLDRPSGNAENLGWRNGQDRSLLDGHLFCYCFVIVPYFFCNFLAANKCYR